MSGDVGLVSGQPRIPADLLDRAARAVMVESRPSSPTVDQPPVDRRTAESAVRAAINIVLPEMQRRLAIQIEAEFVCSCITEAGEERLRQSEEGWELARTLGVHAMCWWAWCSAEIVRAGRDSCVSFHDSHANRCPGCDTPLARSEICCPACYDRIPARIGTGQVRKPPRRSPRAATAARWDTLSAQEKAARRWLLDHPVPSPIVDPTGDEPD